MKALVPEITMPSGVMGAREDLLGVLSFVDPIHMSK